MGQGYEFSKPIISDILHSARIHFPTTSTNRPSNSRTNALLPKSMKEIFILSTTILLWNFSWLNMMGTLFDSLFIFFNNYFMWSYETSSFWNKQYLVESLNFVYPWKTPNTPYYCKFHDCFLQTDGNGLLLKTRHIQVIKYGNV